MLGINFCRKSAKFYTNGPILKEDFRFCLQTETCTSGLRNSFEGQERFEKETQGQIFEGQLNVMLELGFQPCINDRFTEF